jgi:homoserine dehydrogenase
VAAREVRIVILGLGTVGRWVLGALHEHASRLERRYGFRPRIVAVANMREGLVSDARGLDPVAVLASLSGGRLGDLPAVRFSSNLEGLAATEADLLIEVTSSPAESGEPGLTHIREALRNGIAVVTSNKWPVALHGLELVELARAQGVPFRAESTVMSGTPLLSVLVDGLAGTTPTGLRGILNATANVVLALMEQGSSYEEALAEAQTRGLAERDPTADVEGYDAMAKAMILAALVFEKQLDPADVTRRGISEVGREQIDAARSAGARIKEVVTLEPTMSGGTTSLTARVEPTVLQHPDPLSTVTGVMNAVVYRVEPVGEVVVSGPGAGPRLAGQGVFSDLIAVALRRGACVS